MWIRIWSGVEHIGQFLSWQQLVMERRLRLGLILGWLRRLTLLLMQGLVLWLIQGLVLWLIYWFLRVFVKVLVREGRQLWFFGSQGRLRCRLGLNRYRLLWRFYRQIRLLTLRNLDRYVAERCGHCGRIGSRWPRWEEFLGQFRVCRIRVVSKRRLLLSFLLCSLFCIVIHWIFFFFRSLMWWLVVVP